MRLTVFGLAKFAIIAIVAVYLLVVVAVFLMQRQLQYFPSRANLEPASVGLEGVEVETLTTPDGEKLVLWYRPAQGERPTILFYHGNAGSIADRAPRLAHYAAQGYGAAFVSYRGFGGSTGEISEHGLMTDARTAYDFLLAKHVSADNLVLVGESLGTGVAVQLAAERPVGAVVLGAPYSAAVDVGAKVYPWLPVRWLMKDTFISTDYIGKLTAPLLILHGTNDDVIPYTSGQRLFAAANDPKTFVTLEGAGHDVLFEPATWAQETNFLAQIFPR